jgi:M6 family metalloprotease-like protein
VKVSREYRLKWVYLLATACLALVVWVVNAALWSPPASASPAAPIKITLKQPGGKTFAARQYGDEWNNGFETLAGFTVVRDRGSGKWEYATKGSRGKLESSGKTVGKDTPPRVKKHLRSDTTSVLPQSTEVQSPALSTPNTGTQRNLIILVRFLDQAPVGSTPTQWNNKFFGTTDSVQDYYQEASYGKLTMAPAAESSGTANDGVVGWLTMNYNHPNTAGNIGDSANHLLARDAVQAANPYVNYASFDSNGDGFLSSQELHVTVIVAGYEQSYGGTCGKSVWGHRGTLSGTEQPVVDGIVVGDFSHGGGYTEFGEWHCDHMATIGIMVHELGHDLYLPDMYDTNPNDGTSEGVGKWSVMGDSWSALPGNYQGTLPSQLDAWSKSYEGWLTPKRTSGIQAIGQAETNATALQLRANPNGVDWTWGGASGTGEYFLVENRQRVGYDAALPGCGLLVWHIDETRTSSNLANADETRKLVDVEEADGRNDLDNKINRGDNGDLYPGNTNNTSFNNTSNPNSKLYSGSSSGVAVDNVSGSCSSTMSANLTDPGVVRPANDDLSNAQGLTGSSTTVSGTNIGATKEAGEPNHAGNPGGKSVWYKWTPNPVEA